MHRRTALALTSTFAAALVVPAVTHVDLGTTFGIHRAEASSHPSTPVSRGALIQQRTARATDRQSAGVVLIDSILSGGEGAGTGIVLTSDGTVLTNYHVVQGSRVIRVTVPGGATYRASVVGHDATHDVAVLKLAGARRLATARLDPDGVTAAEPVLAVGQGNGQGVLYAAPGRVVARNRTITATNETSLSGSEKLSGLLQSSTAIVPGYSGGPLLDADGEVVGIDTAAAATNGTGSGSQANQAAAGYAIPISTARTIMTTILKGTRTATNHLGRRAALGVSVAPSGATPDSDGVTVRGLSESSAMGSTGIQPGDRITKVGSRPITDSDDLAAALDRSYPGQRTTVEWTSFDGEHTATITLGTNPEN